MVSWQILALSKAASGEGQDEWISRGEIARVRDHIHVSCFGQFYITVVLVLFHGRNAC